MSTARFIDPPASIYRRRPAIGPGLMSFVGAVVAALFLLLLLGMLEIGPGAARCDSAQPRSSIP